MFFTNIKTFIIVRQNVLPKKAKLAFAAHLHKSAFLPVEMQSRNNAVTHSNLYYLCLLLPPLVVDVTVCQGGLDKTFAQPPLCQP